MATETLEELRNAFPDAAKDIKLNLQAVLSGGNLSVAQRAGVAIATAIASRNGMLARAIIEELGSDATVVEDAKAAAALMAMNNVYYRSRHMLGKPEYENLPARLRMNRLASPSTNRLDFELYCLAVSAVAGCEVCLRSHEAAVVGGGLTPEQVNDALRIAATMNAAAVSLEIAALRPSAG